MSGLFATLVCTHRYYISSQGKLFAQHPETATAWLRYGENLLLQGKLKEAAGALRQQDAVVGVDQRTGRDAEHPYPLSA